MNTNDIYGAGLAELGSNITKGWDTVANIKAGRTIKSKLEKGIPAIVKLKEAILEARKGRGYLLDIQGQMFRLRSDHSALNEVNQRAGAIIMKVAQIMLDEELQRIGLNPGLDYEFMLTVHDEWQLAVLPDYGELVSTTATQAIADAATVLKFRCPLKGSASIGRTWADTH